MTTKRADYATLIVLSIWLFVFVVAGLTIATEILKFIALVKWVFT